ncbi:MAG TPA: hypothetical protein ENI34_02905 [candidate division WOR-3 bacterium]|uniref:Uncharacterized protein n=1 Tax=candidate division WOR-3 bacterium TaxID=2052148 RepID=A0A9C9ELC2_UNCW3|nr:hypothetical protein [candidate division WOR-3 bacterium]
MAKFKNINISRAGSLGVLIALIVFLTAKRSYITAVTLLAAFAVSVFDLLNQKVNELKNELTKMQKQLDSKDKENE